MTEHETPIESPAPPLGAGTTLPPGYTVIDLLSRGNDLDVYDAWSSELETRCVLKMLRPDRLQNEKLRRRLAWEGEMLTTLHHPHLVRGYEYVDGASPMVSMETITGSTLDAILDDRASRLPWIVIACLGEHLCSALQYLHRRNILHLDLKPGNIVSEAGKAKVLDLSLAHAPGRGPAGWGTPAYMAPEQANGDEFTTACDVWAVGLILYEAATGVQPFEPLDTPDTICASAGQTTYLQLQLRAEPVRKFRRLPASLATIIDRCLDPDPQGRPDIAELLGVLRSFLSPLMTAHVTTSPAHGGL